MALSIIKKLGELRSCMHLVEENKRITCELLIMFITVVSTSFLFLFSVTIILKVPYNWTTVKNMYSVQLNSEISFLEMEEEMSKSYF
jgi:hypothetical protein